MDNPDFSHDVAVFGLWQPLAFAERYGMKVYFLEPYDSEKIPVLFVHGASGHPAVWENMVEQLDRSRFQPWFLFYPSGVWLDMLGSASASYLEELRLQHHFDQLIVVAHSMGGLVARHMIKKYAKQTTRCRIPVFITLATPWQGHNAASIGVRFAPAVVPSWTDLSPGSEFLQELFEAPLPLETEHALFFSYRKLLGAENNDGSVTLDSQLFLQAQDEASRITGIHAGHTEILSEPAAIDRVNRVLDNVSKEMAGE